MLFQYKNGGYGEGGESTLSQMCTVTGQEAMTTSCFRADAPGYPGHFHRGISQTLE